MESCSLRTAGKSTLGKMGYHVPSAATLTSFHEAALTRQPTHEISDAAIMCSPSLRPKSGALHDCTVLDSEVQAMFGRAPVQPSSYPSRLLCACVKGPITVADVSKHIAALKGPAHTQPRPDLLQELGRLGLGQVRQGCRLPNHPEGHRAIEFYRHTLCPEVSRCLQRLGVPVAFWRPSAEMPPMQGAGRRGAAPKKYHHRVV